MQRGRNFLVTDPITIDFSHPSAHPSTCAYLHCSLQGVPVVRVRLSIHLAAPALVEVEVLFRRHQSQPLLGLLARPGQELVEDVEVSFLGRLPDYTGLFEQVSRQLRAKD